MAPHNRGSLENIPLVHDNGLGEVIRHHGAGNSREVREQRVVQSPLVEVLEQPLQESRFRYSRESRTNGSIHGVHSTEAVKTYPTIRVNYDSKVKIRVSCVNKAAPYKPHPHKLVGRDCGPRSGVCTREMTITERNRIVQLMHIGIQCTKREQIARALQDREIDPFGTGYDEPTAYTSTMLHFVRLAIEVFIPDEEGQLTRLLAAVVTDVITDLPIKMHIFNVTPRHGSAHGGTQITMLTSKLPGNELTVRFQDESADWQVDVRPVKVHHLLSVVVDTPPYCNPNTRTPAHVTIRLIRPATGDPDIDRYRVGEPCAFFYMPGPDLDLTSLEAPKRPRTEEKKLLYPLQHDLGGPGNEPPEPQPRPSTSTASMEINPYIELDKWFYQNFPSQSSQYTPGMHPASGTIQPQPYLERNPINPSQAGPESYRQVSQGQRQKSQEKSSQTAQNPPTGQPASRGRPQAAQSSKQGQQLSRTLPSQHRLEPYNVVDDLLSLDNVILPRQALTPQAQNNLTPNSIAPQKESNLKRTHSQMNGNQGSHSILRPSQMETPTRAQYSQTELPRPYPSPERPNFQNAQPSYSRAPNPTPSPREAYPSEPMGSQFEPRPHFLENQANEFLEIPPNQFEVFQKHSMLIPEVLQTPCTVNVPFPLIDLTEPEHVGESTLSVDELRFYEDQPNWQNSMLDLAEIFSPASQEYQGNQQEQSHQVLPTEVDTSNPISTDQSSEEIKSLSGELAKFFIL